MGDSLNVKDDSDLTAHKPVMLFGKDVTEIICFRGSFICGICSGVAGGLVSFLATSKTLFSTHMAFASLWVGVFAYWIPCRYNFEHRHLVLESLQKKYKKERMELREKERIEREKEEQNAS